MILGNLYALLPILGDVAHGKTIRSEEPQKIGRNDSRYET